MFHNLMFLQKYEHLKYEHLKIISSEMPQARTPENEIVESIREIKKDVKGINKVITTVFV